MENKNKDKVWKNVTDSVSVLTTFTRKKRTSSKVVTHTTIGIQKVFTVKEIA